MTASNRVCVGQITGAHGVRGLVKLRSFTADPAAVAEYGPLTDQSGRRSFRVRLLSAAGDQWIAQVEGVSDRDQAAALRGVSLFVDRAVLPEPEEDEFYHADLIGLRAETVDGETFGTVLAVHDFGAGDLLEIRMATGRTVMLPFTRAAVPVVELKAGRVVIDPPAGFLDEPTAEERAEAGGAGAGGEGTRGGPGDRE
ncbi:ribosome maturation factor RimM [Arenibaculum pallidiluteum]|uniref:ribosome maturation factor RimM n=1 Tax=Arenibaculum pallidiluteum TaxID=2812559 RepID=UPI001A958D59|nr:ribosome maturation factor RimM [Arenibaculum pallidiluteum]